MRLLLLLIIVLGTVQGHSAIPVTAPVESTHYADFDIGYRIDLPSHWRVQRNFMRTDVFAAAPPLNGELGSRANMSILTAPVDEEQTLEQFFNESLSKIRNKFENLKIVETGKVYLGGIEGRKAAYSFVDESGVSLRVTQYFLMKDHTDFVITTAAASSIFLDYAPDFDQALRSFKVID